MIQRTSLEEYNKLFENVNIKQLTPNQINATKRFYDYIVESAQVAKEEGKKLGDVIDEGILTGLLGGLAGSTVGTSLTKAICKVLGINETGVLGKLITSPLVMGALGAEIGFSM